MRRQYWLIVWICVVIFPAGWIIRLYEPVRIFYDQVFSLEWMHMLAHLVLFGILAFSWLQIFPQPGWLTALLRLTALTLLVGGIQEAVQWLTAANFYKPLLWQILSDLAIDLIGAYLGALVSVWFLHIRKRELSSSTRRPTM